MRVGFRTTIEKDLVDALKKKAIESNVNANDILEDLLSAYLYEGLTLSSWDVIKEKLPMVLSMNKEDRIKYISSYIAFNLSRAFLECGIDLKTEQELIVNHISEAITKIISDDIVFMKKNEK